MSKDYIERGALESKAVYMHGFGKNKYVPLKAIQQAQAADVVEVKHGRWKREYDPVLNKFYWSCSECKEWAYSEGNYCPNCGARMDGGADNG